MNDRFRLLISPRATADLDDIASYIARDSALNAARFTIELETECAAIARFPRAYTSRADLVPGLRMAVHKRDLIFFRELAPEAAVRIERVLHGARDLPSLFK